MPPAGTPTLLPADYGPWAQVLRPVSCRRNAGAGVPISADLRPEKRAELRPRRSPAMMFPAVRRGQWITEDLEAGRSAAAKLTAAGSTAGTSPGGSTGLRAPSLARRPQPVAALAGDRLALLRRGPGGDDHVARDRSEPRSAGSAECAPNLSRFPRSRDRDRCDPQTGASAGHAVEPGARTPRAGLWQPPNLGLPLAVADSSRFQRGPPTPSASASPYYQPRSGRRVRSRPHASRISSNSFRSSYYDKQF